MTPALRLPIEKEIRALLPTWLACAAPLFAAGVLGDSRLYFAAVFAYGLGAIALGALSIGHEYTGRTLALLLSQPADRRRLFLTKLMVVAVMLLTLGTVAWAVLSNGRTVGLGFAFVQALKSHGAATLVLPALAGLFVAPLLTMICRSPMAGIVFTIAILGSVWGLGEVLAVIHYGPEGASRGDVESLRFAVLWRGVIGLSAVAAVSSWRMFSRLEAIEGRDQDIQLPRWWRERSAAAVSPAAAPARNLSPMWQLAKKELHLQQMTFVVVGIYVLLWGSISLVRHMVPEALSSTMGAVTILYGPLLALLAGSLASAEERQFGTLEWQVLLPVAMWKQWAVKAGMALGLAVVLGVGLPALLIAFNPSTSDVRLNIGSVALVIMVATVGLYVSSASTSGVRALLLSLPVTLALALFGVLVTGGWGAILFGSFSQVLIKTMPTRLVGVDTAVFLWRWVTPSLSVVLAAAFLTLVFRFALVNHRSAERYSARAWKQGSWIAGSLLLGAGLLTVVSALALATIRANQPPRKGGRLNAPTTESAKPQPARVSEAPRRQ
jgi:hypothetical protein